MPRAGSSRGQRRHRDPARAAALGLATLLTALAGCSIAVVDPALPPPPERLAPIALLAPDAADAAVAAAPASAPEPADTPGWWRDLAEPQLDARIARALAASPQIEAGRHRLAAAEAMRRVAATRDRPRLALVGDTASNPGTRTGYVVTGLELRWEPDLFGRGRAYDALAAADQHLAETRLAALRLALAAEVARTHFEWRLADDRQRRAERHAADASARADAAARRGALRLAPQREVAAARDQADAARDAAGLLAGPGDAHAERLAVLLGIEPADVDTLRGLLAHPASPLPDAAAADRALPRGLDGAVLLARLDVAAARAEVLRAAANAGIADAERWPSLALRAGAGLAWPVVGRDSASSAFGLFALGPSIDWTLLDGGRSDALRAARAAELEAARADYRQTLLAAAAEVQQVLRRLDAADAGLAQATRALDARRRAADAAGAARQLRLADPEAVRAADAELDDGEGRRVEALVERRLAFVALVQAIGGHDPWQAAR